MRNRSVRAALAALSFWLALTSSIACAKGTITVVQSNGETNVYDDVGIKIVSGALFITSEDGKGTIVVHKAACSYQGKVLVCFPTSVTLVQSGKVKPLDLTTGTVYVNSTNDYQSIALSSQKLAPHTLWFTFSTRIGTHASVTGRIDKVVKNT